MLKGNLIIWLALGCCAFTIDWGLSWLLSIALAFLALIGGILFAIYHTSLIRVSRTSSTLHNSNLDSSSFNTGNAAVSGKMVDLMKENDALSHPDDEITGISEVDAQLNLVLDYMIRDYVIPWSRRVSCTDDNHVLDESLKQKLRNAFAIFATPFLSIDWVDYFTAQLVDDFAMHLHLYRIALERVKTRRNARLPFGSDDDLIEEAFFEAEAELGDMSREAVSRNATAETYYFEGISDLMLSQLVTPPEFESAPFRLLGRSVLVWAVFQPSLEAIANPDLFNRNVIWLCRGTPISADHFTVITRTSTSAEELTAVLERVSFELSRCHALDALTESHELREQLASLYQLQQLCDRRLLELQMPRARSSAMVSSDSNENLTGDSEIERSRSKPANSVSVFGLSSISDDISQEPRNSSDSAVFLSQPVIQDQMLITLEPSLLKFNDIINNPTLLDQFTAFVKKRNMYQYLTFFLNAQAFATSFSEAIHRLSAPVRNEIDIEADAKSLSLSGDSVSLLSVPDTRSLPGGLLGTLSKSTTKSLAQMVSNNAGTLFENYLSPRADSSQSLRLDEGVISRTYAKIEKTIAFLQRIEHESVDILQTIPTDLFSEVTTAALLKLETRALPAFRKELEQQILAERSSSSNRTIFGSEQSASLPQVSEDGSNKLQTNKSSSSLPVRPNVSNNNQISAKIVDAHKVLTNTESYVVYVIHVCSLVYRPALDDDCDGELQGKVDGLSWNTTRRYSDFAELYAIVKDRFPNVASRLHFPKKLLFNNLSDEVITKRMRELGDFVSELLRESRSEGGLDKEAAASLKMMLLLFLQPGPWDRCGDTPQMPVVTQVPQSSESTVPSRRSNSQSSQQNSSRLSSDSSDSPASKLLNGANRLGQMFKAIKTIPDKVDRTVDKLFSFMDLPEEPSRVAQQQTAGQNSGADSQAPSRLTSDRTSVYKFVLDEIGLQRSDNSHPGLGNNGPGVISTTIDPSLNIPMRILIRLGHEIFDLGSPRHDWLRSQFADILSRIIASTHGTSLNRKIVSQVEWVTSREQVVNYVKAFRDLIWPNGRPAASSLADDPNKPQQQPSRHPHSKHCARLVCKAKMMAIVPDEIRTVLSAEASREAIVQLFELFQHPTLNRRLVIVIFEGLLRRLYPSINFDEVFRRLHQNAKLRAGSDLTMKGSQQPKTSTGTIRDQAAVLPNGTSHQ